MRWCLNLVRSSNVLDSMVAWSMFCCGSDLALHITQATPWRSAQEVSCFLYSKPKTSYLRRTGIFVRSSLWSFISNVSVCACVCVSQTAERAEAHNLKRGSGPLLEDQTNSLTSEGFNKYSLPAQRYTSKLTRHNTRLEWRNDSLLQTVWQHLSGACHLRLTGVGWDTLYGSLLVLYTGGEVPEPPPFSILYQSPFLRFSQH